MTRQQAIAIRAAHLSGVAVKAIELQEAVRVLSERPSNTRFRLPTLRPELRERANLVLMFNLGREIGR